MGPHVLHTEFTGGYEKYMGEKSVDEKYVG